MRMLRRIGAGVGGWPVLVLLAACGGSDMSGPALRRSVTFELQPLAGCVSAITDVSLGVTADDGSHHDLRQAVPPGASSVTFADIDVRQGMVRFVASVTSDNGTELYAKDTTVQIDTTTFSIAITPEKRSPVLEVCPAQIQLSRLNEFSAELEVRNPGIDTLHYQAESADCPGACMQFFLPADSVTAGGSRPLSASLLHYSTLQTLQMHVRSPVGSVAVGVSLQPLPDVVVQDFHTTDTLRINALQRPERPVSLTLRNAGNAPAAIFKVAAQFDDSAFGGATFFLSLVVPGGDSAYAFTAAPLAPGDSVTLTGSVIWDGLTHGVAPYRVEGDSCSGDEGLPDYCRVDEFDESNNLSQDLTDTLP